MAKQNLGIWIIGIVVFVLILKFGTNFMSQALVGTESVSRSATPSVVPEGETFTLTYSAIGVSGGWGASIEDAVGSGCTFPSGSASYKSVMLSEDGNTKSITMNAPSSKATCSFTGTYMFSDENQNYPVGSMPSFSVLICTPSWVTGTWSTCTAGTCDWTSKDACLESFTLDGTQTRTVTDSKDCGVTTGMPPTTQDCSVDCTRTVTRNSIAPDDDTNCDGVIDRLELGSAITKYLNSIYNRDQIGFTITAWVGGA